MREGLVLCTMTIDFVVVHYNVGEASRCGRVIQFSTSLGLDKLCVTNILGRRTFCTYEGTVRRRENKSIVSHSCMLRILSHEVIQSGGE